MSEITNNHTFDSFLGERLELRKAYSNLLLEPVAAKTQYLSRAKHTWQENSDQVRGADGVMEKFILNGHYLKKELIQEADSMLTVLEDNRYGYKRDVNALKDAVGRFSAPHAPNAIYRKEYRETLEWVKKYVKPKYSLMSVKFQTVGELKKFLSNPSASSGVFACYTIAKHKRDGLTKEMLSIVHDLEKLAIKQGSMGEPTLVGIRLQASIPLDDQGEITLKTEGEGLVTLDFKYKTRLINMVSFPRIVAEMHYSIEVQHYFGMVPWYAGGKSVSRLNQEMNRCRQQYTHWDSMDYSSYDQSLPGWFIKDAFNIIKEWFVFRNEDESKLFDAVVNDFIHKGLVSDEHGNITMIHDGVESGSMFTQTIDTLCNFIMLAYFCGISGKEIGRDCRCNICGDDNIVFHNGWFSGEDYLNCIRKVFGVKGNPQKSTLHKTSSDDPEYLSRQWTWYGPYRPWKELLIKLIYHEKYRVYDDQVTPQLIIKAYDECYHLGMLEGFDMEKFYRDYPRLTIGAMSEEAARAVGGIVAYEALYKQSRRYRKSS